MTIERKLEILYTILTQIQSKDPNIEGHVAKLINNGNEKTEQKEIIRRLKIQNKKLLEQMILSRKKLREANARREKSKDRLNYLIKVNDSLSKALGSCPNCWGEDNDCSKCAGKGIVGWRNSNKRLFNRYIRPF